jgi:IS5 family transposase
LCYAFLEGRISVLKHCYNLDRCLNHGQDSFHRWVGWGVIAHNLKKIGTTVAAKSG